MITVHCPACGKSDIREKNVAYAELPVTEWELDDDGALSPVSYDTNVDVEWEPQDIARQYWCHGCGNRFALAELLARSVAEADT